MVMFDNSKLQHIKTKQLTECSCLFMMSEENCKKAVKRSSSRGKSLREPVVGANRWMETVNSPWSRSGEQYQAVSRRRFVCVKDFN